MAQSSRARPPIDRLTNGTGNSAGVDKSNSLMTAVDALGQSFTTNREGIAAYKQVVERGLTNINRLVNQITELIGELTNYIELLNAELNASGNDEKLNAIIKDLEDQKLELISVINYAGDIIQQNGLDDVNKSLTTSTAEANTLITQITDKLNEAITKARTALGQQSPAPAPAPIPSSSAAGGAPNQNYAARQANVGDITDTKLKDYVNKVIGNIVSTKDPNRRTQLLTEATDIINSDPTPSKGDKDRAIQQITEKYNNSPSLGGKRTHRSHRHRRTKKSRTHKKSKKSRKINYKGGYRAKFPNGQGRGSHKRRSKHTSHRQ